MWGVVAITIRDVEGTGTFHPQDGSQFFPPPSLRLSYIAWEQLRPQGCEPGRGWTKTVPYFIWGKCLISFRHGQAVFTGWFTRCLK